MANYRRTATGNWSTLAQWQDDSTGSYVNSTVLPGATDVVYANNFNVTLDIDVVVSELRTTTALNVNAGGSFNFGAGNSVTANCFAGNSVCVNNNTPNLKTIVGNVFGGNQQGVFTSANPINIIGNCIGGNGGNGNGVQSNAGIININGNVIGGLSAAGARAAASGVINITGNAIASSTFFGAICDGTTSSMRANTAVASTNYEGIQQASTGLLVIRSSVSAVNGRQGVVGLVKFDDTAPKTVQVTLENNTTVTLVDNSVPNYPLEADVEQGVGYGPANIYTGTLVASISPQDIFTAIANSSDPIAVRLRNVSTVATTAATVASFDV